MTKFYVRSWTSEITAENTSITLTCVQIERVLPDSRISRAYVRVHVRTVARCRRQNTSNIATNWSISTQHSTRLPAAPISMCHRDSTVAYTDRMHRPSLTWAWGFRGAGYPPPAIRASYGIFTDLPCSQSTCTELAKFPRVSGQTDRRTRRGATCIANKTRPCLSCTVAA